MKVAASPAFSVIARSVADMPVRQLILTVLVVGLEAPVGVADGEAVATAFGDAGGKAEGSAVL